MSSLTTLRRATPADKEVYFALEKSVDGSKMYHALLKDDEILDEIAKSVTYLILKDDEVVGSISYEIKSLAHADIDGFLVDPRFQGQGIGREAMRILLEELRAYESVSLVTHPENTRALQIYLSFGFVINSWKDNYFGDGEPRIGLVWKNR
jgi:ribosomal protein S18 acetylase RimI-like enzyme